MTKLSNFKIFLSLSLLSAYCLTMVSGLFAVFEKQTSGVSSDLHAVHFVNEKTGWAVGASGTILTTADGGVTWTSQTSGTSTVLRDVHFVNSSTGLIVGSQSTFLKTTNAGSSWTAVSPGLSDTVFYGVYWTSETQAWAAAESGKIRKSADGGNTWSNGAPNGSGTSNDLKSIFFINTSTGWACGNSGTVLRTYNAGETWTAITADSSLRTLNDIFFINASTGFVVGNSGVLIKTVNSGTTWSSQISTSATLNSIHFFGDTGKTVGNNPSIFKSADTGASFSAESNSVPQDLHDVFFATKTLVIAVGASGTILRDSSSSDTSSSTGTIERGSIKAINNLFDPSKNEAVTIQYNILDSGKATLKIYSMQGRLVKTLLTESQSAGGATYSLQWDGKNEEGEIVSSGIYLVHIESPGFSKSYKIAVVQ